MELCYECEGKGFVELDDECNYCLGDGFIEIESPLTFIRGRQNRRKLGDEEELLSSGKKEVKK